MKRALLVALLGLSGCVTTGKDAAPLPKDVAQLTTEDLKDLVAGTLPAPAPVPVKPLIVAPPMTVVALPSPSPIVSLRLVFRAGSVDDPPGREGLTALTARVLVEGGTKKLSSSELLDALYPMAAELDVSVDKEYTVLSARVHKDRLERLLGILADTLLEPRLDEKELERLRSEQLTGITTRLRGENDEVLSRVALDALLYPKHPYGHFIGGTEAGVKSLTMEDVRWQWKRVFTKDRLVLGLAGPVDDALKQQVTKALAALPDTGGERAPLPPAPGVRGRTLIIKRDTLSTAGAFGVSWPMRRDHPEYFAVALGLSYLGEHRQEHGVLFQELRDKRGLNYGTYAYAEHFEQAGWSSNPRPNVGRTSQEMSIWLRPVEAKNGVFATRAVLHSLDEVLNKPIPTERFETARGFLKGALRTWTLGDQRRLGWAIDELVYGTPGFVDRFRDALDTLTPERMQAALKKHLTPGHLNFVFVTKDVSGLKATLLSGEKTPITYDSPKPEAVLKDDEVIASERLPMLEPLTEVIEAQDFMAK